MPAVSKHIRILERAGLIERRIEGRDHYLRAIPGALGEVEARVTMMRGMWSDTLDSRGRPIPQHGVFKVFDRPKVHEFTWNSPYIKDSLVRITLTGADGGTQVDLVHTLLPDQDSANRHQDGSAAILDLPAGSLG